ncbi:MAG: RNA polymerase sigma factor [Candidatus Ozemobacteraceae bacterium]
MEDNQLIAGVQEGQRGLFDLLVERYLPITLGFLKSLGATPHQSEDVAQETFIKAFQNIQTYVPKKPFVAWLLTIAKNTWIDETRKVRRELITSPDDFPEGPSVDTPESQLISKLGFDEVLSHLPLGHQMVLVLRVIYDIPFTEIAEITGENEGALRVKYHRLIGRLRKSLGNERNI